MSKQSRQFQVPDALANLYDFANMLDERHFTHHGVPHRKNDELKRPDDLAAWMAQRKLSRTGANVTPAMLETALSLRASLRDYLQHDPAGRQNRSATRAPARYRIGQNVLQSASARCKRDKVHESDPDQHGAKAEPLSSV